MQPVAAAMTMSPRQAPDGACVSPVASAMPTPATAIPTPSRLRLVGASTPMAAATSIVTSGSVANASEPRAAVV